MRAMVQDTNAMRKNPLTMVAILPYLLYIPCMIDNLCGHIAILLDAYGLFTLSVGEGAQAWWLLYSPIWVCATAFLVLLNLLAHNNTPVSTEILLALLGIPTLLTIIRMVGWLFSRPYFSLSLQLLTVYAVWQSGTLLRYGIRLWRSLRQKT